VQLPLFLAFDNRNVAFDWKILEATEFHTNQRPAYLKTIDLLALFQTQDDTRVGLGKPAASAEIKNLDPISESREA
jgi:hypothetical protein